MFTMDQVHTIRELYYNQGLNLKEIAEKLNCDWRTVKKYVDQEDFSPPKPVKKEQERSETKQNFLTVPAALRELEKIEMIKLWNKEYCFNYSITATQRRILKAFDLTPANIREQAKLLAAELKSIEEGETKMAAAR